MYSMGRVKGFTLIELLISMLLGLVLMGGMISIFNANQQSYRVVNGLSRLQDNARLAFDLISHDIRMAGYMGCLSKVTLSNFINRLKPSDIDYLLDMGTIFSGYVYKSSMWSPTLNTQIQNLKPSTSADILVIRRASDEGAKVTKAMPDTSADIKVEANITLEDEEIVLISDCTKATLFQITNLTTMKSGSEYNIVHNTGGSIDPGNVKKELTEDGTSYGEDAAIYKMESTVYYLANSGFPNNQGSTVMSLWRQEGLSAAEELVRGVEEMTFLYGEDTNVDGVPNRYVTADLVSDMSRVVAIRIHLRLNTVDEVSSQGNTIARDFDFFIKVRNT
ncbi:PilW family protein [Zooshikella harenae]|uniref:PilW family protein n=1 Tax=Zooshikella harenae TaxID=2827238 RepID=A0ABS5ZAF6_9GAMM|nr:PilW family protein [Zooshikella harenae]MBU2711037.1 PilW family protein [Zooshikella harenae]